MKQFVAVGVLVWCISVIVGCGSIAQQTPTRVAIVPTSVATITPTVIATSTAILAPSATPTATFTPTATATRTNTNALTPTPTATLTRAPTSTATLSPTKPAATASPAQVALKHFVEGRAWLNVTAPQDVPSTAARYFAGEALQQTIEEAQWESEHGARYKVGELTVNLWSAQTDEGMLIFELTRAGKAVQYDLNWKQVNAFDVNPLSIVYVMMFDAHDGRWKVDHTKSAVDTVTGKSLLEK